MKISDRRKLLDKIVPQYRSFCEVHTRSSSRKHVVIVAGDHFAEFLQTLLSSDADDQTKLVLSLALSGGMRISEVLQLQRNDVEKDGDNTYITCKVLKKRTFVQRQLIVHPLIVPLLTKYALSKRGFDKLFSLNRFAALYRIKTVIGSAIDLHSLRHSYISFLAFTRNFSAEKIATLQEMNIRTVETYLHLDQKTVLRDIYSGKKVA